MWCQNENGSLCCYYNEREMMGVFLNDPSSFWMQIAEAIQAIHWHFTMDRFHQRLQSRSLNTGRKHCFHSPYSGIQYSVWFVFTLFIYSLKASKFCSVNREIEKKKQKHEECLFSRSVLEQKPFGKSISFYNYVDSHSHNRVLSIVR